MCAGVDQSHKGESGWGWALRTSQVFGSRSVKEASVPTDGGKTTVLKDRRAPGFGNSWSKN